MLHTPPPSPPLSFLRFRSFLGLSLRLFRLFLRLVSLPQSRAKYSPFFYTYLSLALLALLFLCFFLLFLRIFRCLFRSFARAPQSGTVCVSTPVPKGSDVSKQGAQAHRGYLCQRSCSTMGDAEIDHLRVPAELFFKLSLHSSSLCFMVVLTTDPKTFPSAAFSCRALTACECLST